jgi:enoyl-CoA hydratase/carnithine racemase
VADTVRYELDGHVATITYHRPDKLNVIDQQMRTELTKEIASR